MPFPNLPQTDPAQCAFAFATSGNWEGDIAPDFLDRLVISLAQGATLNNAQSIDSVPHVWSKPLLFKMALFDTNHFVVGLKQHVTREWRALLAMLALKDMLHVPLTVYQINLTPDFSPQAAVFKALAPQEALDGNISAWLTNTYIISFNGAPIAMTSPITLVATAADYADNLRDLKIALPAPWSNNGFSLTDPISHLNNNARNALECWLTDLHTKLSAMLGNPNANGNLISSLLNCVSSYINDVNAQIITHLPAINFNLTPSPLNLAPFLGGLLQNSIKIAGAGNTSDVKLQGKNLLLVSPKMLEQLTTHTGIPLANIEVWNGHMADSITAAALHQHNQIAGVILPKGVEFRRPEEFFNDQMVLILGADVFCNSLDFMGKTAVLPNSKYTAILPIKPELAKIFSAAEISNSVSVSYSNDNGNTTATLDFKFSLSDMANNLKFTYHFQKEYSQAANTLIITRTNIPVVEIWPDFSCALWNTYYLHYSNDKSGAAGAKPDNLCFSPWSSYNGFTADVPANPLANIFTAKMNHFPEALICTYVSTNGISMEAGMVFLNEPGQVALNALHWQIGIDFGTSATMLFYAQAGGAPQPLNLQPHLYQITNSKDGDRTRNTLNFISENAKLIHDGSFLSVFHLLNHAGGLAALKPLQDGHVLLLTAKSPYHKNKQYAPFIYTNIKWDEPTKFEAYISQICMQAFVEALSNGVSNIQWNFSYPLAFTGTQKASFDATCISAVPASPKHSIDTHSESEALAYYFNNLNGFLGNSICIDIGAGTTDISIISGAPGEIIFHTSIQYAGRHMFNSIYKNFSLFAPDVPDFKNALTSNQEQATIDLDMRDNSDNYIANLRKVVVDVAKKDTACRALQSAQLAVAGLFYYLGKILKALHDANYYKSNTLPQIFIGGNGSRIFNWLTWGNDINKSIFTAIFERILSKASGLQKDELGGFSLTLSEKPKIEIASGMILPPPPNPNFFNQDQMDDNLSDAFGNRYSQNAVIAGAAFSTASEHPSEHPSEDFLSNKDIQKGVTIDNLDEFMNFIHVFNEQGKKLYHNGINEDANFNHVIGAVHGATCGFYNNQKGQKDLDKISVEPVFIVELREFIKNA